MSQFDFPRVNFSGRAIINPATGNNTFFQPLVYYDPIRARAFLPPRLYLQEKYLRPGTQPADLLALLPGDALLREDEWGDPYVDIAPIDDKTKFMEWATLPLGTCELDRPYHPLYERLVGDKSKQPIRGVCPGYWNYFGDMTFRFERVRVHSLETRSKKNGKRLFEEGEEELPPSVADLLGAELNMVDADGKKWGVMIDVCPTMALYSQVFCDALVLEKTGKTLLRGKPCKASLRFLNFDRIVNQATIESASGSFFCTIALDDLEAPEENLLLSFFRRQLPRGARLQGLFFRYNLLEVIEEQAPDYRAMGGASNPARATVAGSITPWLAGELRSITMGRLLAPAQPLLPERYLGAMVCRVDARRRLVSLDAIGSIPLWRRPAGEDGAPAFEVFEQGALTLKLEDEQGRQHVLGAIEVGADGYHRAAFLRGAGMIDFSLAGRPELDARTLRRGRLLLEGKSRKTASDPGTPALLLAEAPYMIASDQAGLYAEAGDDPGDGYRSYGYYKEPCLLRVFKKGKPLRGSAPLQVLAYSINAAGMQIRPVDLFAGPGGRVRDRHPLRLPLEEAGNMIYFFTESLSLGALQSMQREITRSGAFINLRVLPRHDYGAYLDPAHPDYPKEVTFETVYREIFQLYDLVYPVSAVISPFNETALRRAAPVLKRLMHPANWASSTYMPSSRELTSAQ